MDRYCKINFGNKSNNGYYLLYCIKPTEIHIKYHNSINRTIEFEKHLCKTWFYDE